MSIKSVDMNMLDEAEWAQAVRQAVASLRYGSVEVLVHDGRVVQVETRRKVRFPDHRGPDERARILKSARPVDRNGGGAALEDTDE